MTWSKGPAGWHCVPAPVIWCATPADAKSCQQECGEERCDASSEAGQADTKELQKEVSSLRLRLSFVETSLHLVIEAVTEGLGRTLLVPAATTPTDAVDVPAGDHTSTNDAFVANLRQGLQHTASGTATAETRASAKVGERSAEAKGTAERLSEAVEAMGLLRQELLRGFDAAPHMAPAPGTSPPEAAPCNVLAGIEVMRKASRERQGKQARLLAGVHASAKAPPSDGGETRGPAAEETPLEPPVHRQAVPERSLSFGARRQIEPRQKLRWHTPAPIFPAEPTACH